MPGPRLRRRGPAILLLTAAVLATTAGACDDDDGDGGAAGDDSDPAPATIDDIAVEPTPVLDIDTDVDPDYLDGVLADDVVSADELDDAYGRFIDCLAEGGAAGLYAYDIDLRVGLAADWSLAADAAENDAESLRVMCSRAYLGGLIDRYYDANPPPDDLAERQRASVVECVSAVNPDLVASIPDVVTVDTSGTGAFVGDLQLDPASVGAEPGEVEALRRCFGSLGAPWTPFG